MQPGYQQGQPQIDNNMTMSIVSIFLFWPLAIPAIINATKVDPAWQYGQHAEAQMRSEKAKMFCMIATGIGAVFTVIYIILLASL